MAEVDQALLNTLVFFVGMWLVVNVDSYAKLNLAVVMWYTVD